MIATDTSVTLERWPLVAPFKIVRDTLSVSLVVHGALTESGVRLQAEAEADEGDISRALDVQASAAREARRFTHQITRVTLNRRVPPGPVRNVLDCLLWDRDAKRAGVRAWHLEDYEQPPPPASIQTCRTIGLGDPEAMANAARGMADGLLKIKLGGGVDIDLERVSAVRAVAPNIPLCVDANEGWTFQDLLRFEAAARGFDIAFIEQPLPAAFDGALVDYRGAIPLCADESFSNRATLCYAARAYQWINIKLDKCGGLTEALASVKAARRLGLRIMVGCNLGTSLAMAPAYLVAAQADFVDLDGPMLIAQDRVPSMRSGVDRLTAPNVDLWG